MADRIGAPPRPLPSTDQLRVWRDYAETSSMLRRLLETRMQAESGLSNGDYAVMLALREAETRAMRPSELAARIGWDRSRLSHHLGRMEKRGLVRRMRCAEDSRGALVELTADGRELFRRGSVPHLRDVRELFVDAFSAEQLAAVAETTAAMRAHLELLQQSESDT